MKKTVSRSIGGETHELSGSTNFIPSIKVLAAAVASVSGIWSVGLNAA